MSASSVSINIVRVTQCSMCVLLLSVVCCWGVCSDGMVRWVSRVGLLYAALHSLGTPMLGVLVFIAHFCICENC